MLLAFFRGPVCLKFLAGRILVPGRNEDFQVVTGGYFEIRWEGAVQRQPPLICQNVYSKEKQIPLYCSQTPPSLYGQTHKSPSAGPGGLHRVRSVRVHKGQKDKAKTEAPESRGTLCFCPEDNASWAFCISVVITIFSVYSFSGLTFIFHL